MSRNRPPEHPNPWLTPDDVATAPLNYNMELIADCYSAFVLMSGHNYLSFFEENIKPNPIEDYEAEEFRDDRRSGIKRVSCVSNRAILWMIARNSMAYRKFMAKKRGVAVESLPRTKRLTIQSIALVLWDAERKIRQRAATKNGVQMYKDEQLCFAFCSSDEDEIEAVARAQTLRSFEAHVRRVVEGGEVFGLVVLANGEIEGTDLLYNAMVRTAAFDMCLAYAAIQGEGHG